MRNLLLILLLANILYFLWGYMGREAPEPGVAILSESDMGPQLTIGQAPKPEEVKTAQVAVEEAEEEAEATNTTLAAVLGKSCATVGPFRNRDDADTAQARYATDGRRSAIRQTTGQIFIGHWVQIRNVGSAADSVRMMEALEAGGLTDASPITTDDEGRKISLGLFGNLDSAERIELQAQSLGFDADISPFTRDGEVFFVDVALPPGMGAGDIIERYGEDQVSLREQATCPPE